MQENVPYFGYGYIKDVNQLVPNVPLNFYAFRVMVILGGYFILFFILVLFFAYKKDLSKDKDGCSTLLCGPFRWLILPDKPVGWWPMWSSAVGDTDMLPTSVSISKLDVGSVQTTFFIFLVLFTVMLIAEIGIMVREIKKGPTVNH